MRSFLIYYTGITLFVSALSACQSQQNQQITQDTSILVKERPKLQLTPPTDTRPKEEQAFLSRIKDESEFVISSNAAQKDEHINAFNHYLKDSLKKITDWEMIVNEVNDSPASSSSIANIVFPGQPVYNVKLSAPIRIDKTVDTIAVDNRVDFTITVPKSPSSQMMKDQLGVIKALNKGDIIRVSGSITHLDDLGKVNVASFYDDITTWDFDMLATNIVKKLK